MKVCQHFRYVLLWLFDKNNTITTTKEFATEAELRKSIQECMDSRPAGFWVMGFTDLPNRWENIIEYEGDYFPDD